MDKEYEVLVDDGWVAGVSGPEERALPEAMRYAKQNLDGGDVIEVWEITRTLVIRLKGI